MSEIKKHPVFYIITIGVIIWLSSIAVRGIVHQNFVTRTYNQAVSLTFSGYYNEAAALLWSISDDDYLDSRALRYYCNAQINYASGNIDDAHLYLSFLKFNHITEEQHAEILTAVDQINAAYEAYQEEQYARERREYEDRIRKGVPFVGMSESRISDTILGAPAPKIGRNTEMKNGNVYWCNIYDWNVNGRTVFSARCMEGKVIKVWDWRDKQTTSTASRPSTSSGSYSSSNKNSDPLQASEYSHPDDFYEDHWDDFFDYEDAEDYWDENH